MYMEMEREREREREMEREREIEERERERERGRGRLCVCVCVCLQLKPGLGKFEVLRGCHEVRGNEIAHTIADHDLWGRGSRSIARPGLTVT